MATGKPDLDIISRASGLKGPVLFDEWKNTGSVSQLNLGPRGAYTAAAACATAATQIADIKRALITIIIAESFFISIKF